MNKILKHVALLTGAIALFTGVGTVTAHADSTPRVDMIDTSNHNGQMTTPEFVYMRNTHGLKAVTTKISEGVGFHDYTARGNIASAKQAGLYINGYHYLHATTVAGAIQEADYAVNMAKADGLPVGAVLAVDIEQPYQIRMGRAMQPIAKAFENEVARYGGYRSTTYTGGSGISVSPDGEKAWIAQYPYYPTADMRHYSTEHSWQWSSSVTFASSIGRFDASILYDDFFTAGIKVGKPVTVPAKPVQRPQGQTSAIQKFKNAGNKFTGYKSFRVDKIAYVNGMWQAINYDMAGGKDANWTTNGIPLAMLDNITRGNSQPTRVGDQVKFMAGYNHGTIDRYDNGSNGTGIVEGRYGMIWYNANSLLNK